jgi:hypothetical protein
MVDCHIIHEDQLPAIASALEAERRAALEEAAKVAEWAHMVPPDGGSPTEEEKAVADEAARRIRARIGEGGE